MKLPLPKPLVRALVNHAKKTPFDHLTGYMNRYWLVAPNSRLSKWLVRLNRNWKDIRIHEILRGDADRHLHDHPWPYTTIILAGGYTEVTLHDTAEQAYAWQEKEGRTFFHITFNDEMQQWESRIRYEAGSVLVRQAYSAHRLEVEPYEKAVTCFIMGQYQNKWGFYTPEGKVYWRDYLDAKDVTRRAAVIKTHYDQPETASAKQAPQP